MLFSFQTHVLLWEQSKDETTLLFLVADSLQASFLFAPASQLQGRGAAEMVRNKCIEVASAQSVSVCVCGELL